MKRSKYSHFILVAGLIFIAAACRVVTHHFNVWNFTPMVAVSLFAAAKMKDRRLALLVPVGAMLLSDWAIHLAPVWYVYLTMLLITVMGFGLERRQPILRIAAYGIVSSVLFFLITNFAVWLQSVKYARNISGLMACYTAGIPFYRNELAGDALYTLALFGAYAWLVQRVPAIRSTVS